jgi:hypothetical protein
MGNYVERHKLLTIGGTSYSGTETWQFGLRFSPTAPAVDVPDAVTQAQVDACVTPVQTWWNTVAQAMPNTHKLAWVKLAPIAPTGLYPPGEIAYINDFTDITGPGSSQPAPPQCALVVTLVAGSILRGKGRYGRIYLPAPALRTTATGQISTTGRDAVGAAVSTMINSLNAVTDLGHVTVLTKPGLNNGVVTPATFGPVTDIKVGNVLDTQRRRRKGIPETYATWDITAH